MSVERNDPHQGVSRSTNSQQFGRSSTGSSSYVLDKYYGNLDISEYRSMLEKEQLLVVVDKPLTKIYPELIEENGDTPNIYNNLLNTVSDKSTLRLRRNMNEGNITKNSKLKKNFNM